MKTEYQTTTMCPSCDRLLPGSVVRDERGIFVSRRCPEHGEILGLVCSDLAWWDSLARFDVEPVRPAVPLRQVDKGCPQDCGLCAAHRQTAGTAAIEISNRCNAKCPVCLADNKGSFEMSVEEVERALQALLRSQPKVDLLALSGGEPTTHPQLFEIIRALERPEVARIGLNSNGLRIAKDDLFLDELARHENVYVSLHHDGQGAKTLRGIDASVQERALERLGKWGIKAAPVVLAARGVNDHELGTIVGSLLTRYSAVRSIVVSMMTHTGSGAAFDGDPLTRLTIPGALDAIEASSGGAIRKSHFMPLPMPNPMCAAIGYFLVDEGELLPLLPYFELDEVIARTRNSNFVALDAGLERLLRDAVDRVYSAPDRYPDPARALRFFRQLLLALFPEGRTLAPEDQRRLLEERVRPVYLMQFMDAWTFDTQRLCKCSCQHLMPDGTVVPSCSYYSYHRQRDPRFAPERAEA